MFYRTFMILFVTFFVIHFKTVVNCAPGPSNSLKVASRVNRLERESEQVRSARPSAIGRGGANGPSKAVGPFCAPEGERAKGSAVGGSNHDEERLREGGGFTGGGGGKVKGRLPGEKGRGRKKAFLPLWARC